MLRGLNPAQVEAVTHGDGALLVLAGAGSGKTRVITHRIAHLIFERGVSPRRIIAVTFTNKAASEMRERVARLLGRDDLGGFIGTFHGLCLRLLRREGDQVGIDKNFNIYDTDDQVALVRRIIKEEGVEDAGTPRSFLSRISRAKNALEKPEDLAARSFSPENQIAARIWELYTAGLRQANAVDFDDLLLLTLKLFDDHPETAKRYSERCEHLLVDEYQDTNRPQYRLIRHLMAEHGNICVVGDEDQSIYRFRGAEIRNILDFERDHRATRTIRLEQNYRSSGVIIQAAGALIAHNLNRKGKTLWTENPDGDKLELFCAPDDRSEAIWVTERLKRLMPEIGYEDVAVLYRTNAQSRLMEEIFRRDQVPYQIIGSVQFYERKEIKDLVGYLRLVANPSDDVAFRRIVNVPARGIGSTTLQLIEAAARSSGVPLMTAARQTLDRHQLSTRPAKMLAGFLDLIEDVGRHLEQEGVAGGLEYLVQAVRYPAYLEKTYVGMAADRMENVQALISAAVEFAEETDEDTLQAFLDRTALVAGADEIGEHRGVTLMTIHCAKGLEYPVVFLIGLEENLFPHAMSTRSDEDIEEERRLAYVAMTRAERRLFLSHAQLRRFQGALLPSRPSRFLQEIPDELVEAINTAPPGFFDDDAGVAYGGAGGSSAARVARRSTAPAAPAPAASKVGVDPGDGYAVGIDVKHPSFGAGRILDREGSGKHLKLTIQFANHGVKKILPAYTQLSVRVD